MSIHKYKYITTDSRAVFSPADTIFAAIRTDIGDGHRYISDLYKKGVRAFIVEEIPEEYATSDATFYRTDDVPESLGKIARERLNHFDNGIVITGSVGKTKTKELLYSALLDLGYDVRRSPRSWNSSIGVPLAIWDMTSDAVKFKTYYDEDDNSRRLMYFETDADVMITEAGIDGPGQGDFLASVLGKSHKVGIITPITAEHDEAFTSHADKIKEKLKVLANCDTIIYDNSDQLIASLLKEEFENNERGAALYAIEKGLFPTIYHALADKALELQGIAKDKRNKVINGRTLVNKKRQITDGNFGNTIICDYFTHDLRSLQEALDFMRRRATPAHGSVLILDDLKHRSGLGGDIILAIYRQAFELAKAFGVETTICISDEYARLHNASSDVSNIILSDDIADLIDRYHAGELLRNKQIMLFGKNDGKIGEIAAAMESADHDTTLEVDLDALIHNYNYYRSLVHSGTGIIAMVKASAYGLGPIEIGKTLQSQGAAYLAVAVIEEGIALREAGITMPIMVLNPVTNRYPALFAHHLEPVVFSIVELERLLAEASSFGTVQYPIHIKFDTGMHRVGFTPSQVDDISALIAGANTVRVSSVFSHLATADCLDLDDYTNEQLHSFNECTTMLQQGLGYSFRRHILNTAGMMRFADCGSYEMARLGIGLYGISPVEGQQANNLKPVAAFRSHIISLSSWPKGTTIGYGCKGITQRDDCRVATIPVGYADGINRRLGNGRASFSVKGVECPTIGNICMDLCMIDVSEVTDVAIGDTVEIFGPQIPVKRIADILNTIPYEVLTSVSQRVKRTYIKN
ncbi:MAG: alanine racemase [Muribaculaceae bacterium]|nr:alanine racemase [Muribaculaceae bacterium]